MNVIASVTKQSYFLRSPHFVRDDYKILLFIFRSFQCQVSILIYTYRKHIIDIGIGQFMIRIDDTFGQAADIQSGDIIYIADLCKRLSLFEAFAQRQMSSLCYGFRLLKSDSIISLIRQKNRIVSAGIYRNLFG